MPRAYFAGTFPSERYLNNNAGATRRRARFCVEARVLCAWRQRGLRPHARDADSARDHAPSASAVRIHILYAQTGTTISKADTGMSSAGTRERVRSYKSALNILKNFALLLAVLGTLSPAGAAPQQQALSPPTVFMGADTQPQFLRVEEAYPLAIEPDGESALRLIWQMPPGYYLYQHAFRFQLLSGDRTVEVQPNYPPALEREDEYFGLVQVYYDSAEITLQATESLAGAQLAVSSQGCADAGLCYPPRTQHFRIDADGGIHETGEPRATLRAAAANGPATGPASGLSALLSMLLFAFVGGLILNLMPCVLPVLSLKVLSFASTDAGAQRRQGWLYSAGVVSSFLLVAALLLAMRGAGQAVGWGFQLQSSGFVIALAYLFVILGLGLSGLLELGSGFMNVGSRLATRGSDAGSFFTGVLAVLVASPCTAPFMGTALGFALTQSTLVGLTVFAALGAGMAAPLLLLSYSAGARRFIPRPGAWMERLKQALAFPLYATALWLFWVAGRQAGIDVMAAALLGALLLAFAIWLWRGRMLARSLAIACVLAALALASWRPLQSGAPDQRLPAGSVAYSAARLAALRDEGRPVFVDVTADWCITCLANERAVLSSARVQEAFIESGVTYMVADWTDYDADIAEFVASHGRTGIPLYVFYQRGQVPRLLPQILRKQQVLDTLAGPAAALLARRALDASAN
ncbi:MAG: thiol:disulfide interchange protein [Halieaceae bacterium]